MSEIKDNLGLIIMFVTAATMWIHWLIDRYYRPKNSHSAASNAPTDAPGSESSNKPSPATVDLSPDDRQVFGSLLAELNGLRGDAKELRQAQDDGLRQIAAILRNHSSSEFVIKRVPPHGGQYAS
ncbi:hypothetical protein LTR37_009429 [Vermiconidia calcicola]|uniref:Uncharacterized protein n=1 Tax=Vermiconidia calcicola TaxID=1690605 RepID=A0ACC3N7G7_9PEZI|nr:hypothetical protein LTR37_009429 [Vermiconidia calcicola]